MSAASIDIRVPPGLADIRKLLPSSTMYVPDVQALVDMTLRDVAADEPEGGWNVSSIDTPFHDAYHKVEAVYAFGDALKAAFPDIVEEFDIGTTAEGRPIRAWRAHLKANDGEPEHEELEFVIQAGQHAREVSSWRGARTWAAISQIAISRMRPAHLETRLTCHFSGSRPRLPSTSCIL